MTIPQRSTKAGVETPATQPGLTLPRTLAVDRSTKAGGRDPGDTFTRIALPARSMVAQRRPGSRPRRHLRQGRREVDIMNRSTKAGVETPATPSPPYW